MKFKPLLAALLGLVAVGVSAQAAVVLTIDISNPAAVVITAVANNSQSAGTASVNFFGGISFRNFFSADQSIAEATPLAITGSWTAVGTTSSYNQMVTFDYGNPSVLPGVDLSIYNSIAPNEDTQKFVTTAAPFTGSSIVNFSGFTFLPTVGTTGDVNIGYQPSFGGVIGQWQVIPEPSTAMLGAIGALALIRRRR